MDGFSPRRLALGVAALLVLITAGAIGYHASLDETWLQAFYRAVVTVSLAGLDTVPRNDESRAISIVLVIIGVTIFAFVATTLVEGIAQGVQSGRLAEKRRLRAIERLHDHYIICGYGRVGQRIAEEFRHAGASYVVLDFSQESIEAAREHDDYFIEVKVSGRTLRRPQRSAAALGGIQAHRTIEAAFPGLELGRVGPRQATLERCVALEGWTEQRRVPNQHAEST